MKKRITGSEAGLRFPHKIRETLQGVM